MIRGEAADGDQSYVETLCGEYGVTCDSYRIDVRKLAEQAGQTVEEAGRHARYDAFDRMRARYADEGCVIAVATMWLRRFCSTWRGEPEWAA